MDVTLFITSCGRPTLLRRTLESFVRYNTYPIKHVILCEDSGIKGVADFACEILPYPVTFCYNDIRMGQMKTIETYTQLIMTPYVFHLEDDYEFFDSGFIELSLEILKSDSNITQVLLEDEQHDYATIDINHPLCYKLMTHHEDSNEGGMIGNYGDGPLSCFSWRPSLKRIEIQKLRMPYQPWDDEYTLQLHINKLNMYSVITKHVTCGRKGFCRHIGKNNHVEICSEHKIPTRLDFPDKLYIRLKDI